MVRMQLNQVMSTNAVLTQMAVLSMFSKEGGREFSKAITKLTEG